MGGNKMKKVLVAIILGIFLFVGCDNTKNTPTSKVEQYLGKYQKLDKDVLADLDNVLDKDENMSDEQKKEYRTLLEKQYQNLSYKIKKEEVKGNTATVDVEIEVLDYQTSINKSKEYYAEHQDEFKNDSAAKKDTNEATKEKNNNVGDENVRDKAEEAKDDIADTLDNIASFIDYKIQELKNVDTTIKYDLTFNLTKEDGVWVIDDLSDDDRQKLHGLY